MIKASVNFTHNYTQNGLFDVKFNITSIEFEELNEAKVKEVMNAKAPPKPLIYDYKPNNIDDDNYNQHQGFIILAKKYFNVSYSNLIKENHEASTEKFYIINSISNFSSVPNYNLNSNSKDLKTSRGDVYDDYFKEDKTGKNKNHNYNIVEEEDENVKNNKLNKVTTYDPNLVVLKQKGIESCFLFLNPNSAIEALNILFETNQIIHDNWNTIIFIVIILFFFFMKINIFFEQIKTLNKFKYENFPNIFQLKNFYVYVIFNGTLFLIIPLLFFGYDDFNFEFCLGFSDAYFNSFLADRQIFLERQKEYFNPYQSDSSSNGQDEYGEDENLKIKNNFFFVHDAKRNSNNIITRLGYLKNMLFLCVFVWLSGMRNIFNEKKIITTCKISQQEQEQEEENGMNNCDLEIQANSQHGK